jgi:hypothetical protein
MCFNISSRILKDLQNLIAPILTIIFQNSLQTVGIPTDWKHANVAPAYKKGEKYNAANYRPISLTCISCKIMEHVITKHVLNHLESNSLLYASYYCYYKSTTIKGTCVISTYHH